MGAQWVEMSECLLVSDDTKWSRTHHTTLRGKEERRYKVLEEDLSGMGCVSYSN